MNDSTHILNDQDVGPSQFFFFFFFFFLCGGGGGGGGGGRKAIYFRELGSSSNYFQGDGEKILILGKLGALSESDFLTCFYFILFYYFFVLGDGAMRHDPPPTYPSYISISPFHLIL